MHILYVEGVTGSIESVGYYILKWFIVVGRALLSFVLFRFPIPYTFPCFNLLLHHWRGIEDIDCTLACYLVCFWTPFLFLLFLFWIDVFPLINFGKDSLSSECHFVCSFPIPTSLIPKSGKACESSLKHTSS